MSVNLQERYSADLAADIIRNKIDIGLPLISSTTARLDPSYLEIAPLEAETLYLVISDELLQRECPDTFPSCKDEYRRGVSLYRFAHLPMFLHPSNSPFHRELQNAIRAHGIEPFIRVKTSLTSSLVGLCAKGYGIYFSPTILVKYMYQTQYEFFRRLNLFPVLEYAGARQTFLTYHKQKQLNKPMRDAIDIIKKIYAEHEMFDKELLHM